MPSNTGERWFYYTLDSVPVYDVFIGVFKTSEWDASGNVITTRSLSSCQVSWVVSAEYHVPVRKAKALLPIKGDEREEDVLPPNNVIENILAVDPYVEDHWDFRISLPLV